MSKLVGRQIVYRPRDHWSRVDPSLGIEPAILRICKKVHDEAAPVLYGKNAFYFSVPDPCTRLFFRKTEPADELRLRCQCLWLFGYRQESWNRLFLEIQASLFAHFLYQIGKQNAALLTALRFLLEKPEGGEFDAGLTVGPAMNVVMQLLKHHVSGLHDLKVILMDHHDVIGYPIWFMIHGVRIRGSVLYSRHPWMAYCPSVETVMYDVLKGSIQKLSGLRRLGFGGFDRDPYVKRELEELEVGVVREASDEDVETR